jgi:hypothetical protein
LEKGLGPSAVLPADRCFGGYFDLPLTHARPSATPRSIGPARMVRGSASFKPGLSSTIKPRFLNQEAVAEVE